MAAAVKWIDYHYLRKYTNKEAAEKAAEIQVASDQPVGTPELPIFSQEQYEQYQEWIASYVNVPLDQMTSFTSEVFGAALVNEPKIATQDIYAALDTAVQAVLTDPTANIDQLLDEANAKARRAIDAAS